MSVVNSHLDNISIIINFGAAPIQEAGFSNSLLLVDKATNSLDGDRVRTYANVTDAQADETAGFISAATLAGITTYFSQRPQPAAIKVGNVDIAGAESYADGLAAVLLEDTDFFGVAIASRAAPDALILATAVEASTAPPLFYALQSSSADWKTSGVPAGYAGIETKEKTMIEYHDTDTEWQDVAHLAKWLVANPDTQSSPGDLPVNDVDALATAPTQAEKDFLDANFANHGLPYPGEPFFIDAGVNAKGRPIYEVLTADWFSTRLRERISGLKVDYSARNEKLPVTTEGQSIILSQIRAQLDAGVAAGHFAPGQITARALPITAADLTAQRLRFEGEAQFLVSGRKFEFTFNFGRTPLSEA